VTNVTFSFETSPNTNPKRKKWGDMGYFVLPVWKTGGTRPPCSPPNCAHVGGQLPFHGSATD